MRAIHAYHVLLRNLPFSQNSATTVIYTEQSSLALHQYPSGIYVSFLVALCRLLRFRHDQEGDGYGVYAGCIAISDGLADIERNRGVRGT